jgi:hypothetical protein
MRSSDVTVVFAAMSPGMEKLLTSHGVIRTAGARDGDEADIVIDTADGALGTVLSESVCLLRTSQHTTSQSSSQPH